MKQLEMSLLFQQTGQSGLCPFASSYAQSLHTHRCPHGITIVFLSSLMQMTHFNESGSSTDADEGFKFSSSPKIS